MLVIRYEDLCDRPAEELRRSFEHCRVPVDPRMLAESASRLQKPDYYRSSLGNAERERIIDATAPTMARFGYLAGTALP